MDTAIRQSCIIFIYNGVPPTYDTSPRMLRFLGFGQKLCGLFLFRQNSIERRFGTL